MTTGWLLILSALAMSVGWGFRGDYGHEAGAMVPGALLALSVVMASGREDWWRRATLLAMLGAIGWAFGGQMSYGRIIGYTAHSSYPTVAYGYACLFVIGGLWGGIGAAILSLGVTVRRAELARFVGPLIALWLVWLLIDLGGVTSWLVARWELNDTDWVAATSALIVACAYALLAPSARPACALILLLAGGWWLGFGLLTCWLGLRMTPPRSDNWAGCVGLFAGLLFYLWRTNNRVAILMAGYGVLAGGIGFAVSDFVNMLGRAQWGPIGQYEALRGLDYWKWMEQLFGLLMGFGVAMGFVRILNDRVAPLLDDEPEPADALGYVAPVFLLVVMMWENLFKNVRNWSKGSHIPEQFWGLTIGWWFLIVGVMLAALVVAAVRRHRRHGLPWVPEHALGRAQFLFLLILWVAVLGAFLQAFPVMKNKGVFFVHLTFWLTAGAATWIVLVLPATPLRITDSTREPGDPRWRFGVAYWLVWVLVLGLPFALAKSSIATHDKPLHGSHLFFDDPSYPTGEKK